MSRQASKTPYMLSNWREWRKRFSLSFQYYNLTSTVVYERLGLQNPKDGELAASYNTNVGFSGWKRLSTNSDSLIPTTDNALDVGSAIFRMRNIYAGTGTINTSDKREKENIRLLDESILSFLMELNPVEFSFKDYGLRTHWGLIAQEVEEAIYSSGMNSLDVAAFIRSPITEEVETGDYTEDDDSYKIPVMKTVITGERYGLRYEELIAPMLKMIQVQQRKIEDLESRLVALEAKA